MNKLTYLVIFIILVFMFSGLVSANAFTHDCNLYQDCIIQEFYINSTGDPCIGCIVNMTLLYPNQSFKENVTFTEQGSGYYTYNAGVLPVSGFYPATIRGYDEDNDLTLSEQNIISVERSSTRLLVAIVMLVSIAAILMFASFKMSEEHTFLKWAFFTWSLILAFAAAGIVFVDTQTEVFANITQTIFILFGVLILIFVVIFAVRLAMNFLAQIVQNKRREGKE